MKRGRPTRRAPLSWGQAIQNYHQFVEVHRGVQSGRSSEIRRTLVGFVGYLEQRGVNLPAACTLALVDQWVGHDAGTGIAPDTLKNHLSAVRGFLRYLHGEGWLSEDLAAHLEGPRVYQESTAPPLFTWKEIHQLVASVPSDAPCRLRDRAILLLFACTGARCGEIARLRLSDVDEDFQQVTLTRRKRGDTLRLPLLTEVAAALRAYVKWERPADSPHREVFLTVAGRPFACGHSTSSLVRRHAAKAGLGTQRAAHAVRRAVGTRLHEQGAGVGQIALILGHDSLQSVRTYVRLSLASLREVADNYGELL